MPESVDPAKLVSFTQLAKEFGYNAEHLRQLAVQGKLHAWLIGGAMWITTREHLESYMKTRNRTGRRPRSEMPRVITGIRKPTKKQQHKRASAPGLNRISP
jgi:hypothetical protein